MRWLLRSIVVLLTLLAWPVTAAQASGVAVLRDCQAHGLLTHHYSQQDYRDALANMPADIDEYTDCRSVIEQAQAAAAHPRNHAHTDHTGATATTASNSSGSGANPSTGGGGGSGGSTHAAARAATPGDLAAIAHATKAPSSLTLASGAVRPGSESVLTGGPLRSLPTTLRIVLALLVAGTAVATILGVRRRVLARRRRS